MRIFGHDEYNMELDGDLLSMNYGNPLNDDSHFGLFITKEQAELIIQALKEEFKL